MRCFGVFEELGYEHTTIITGGGPKSVKIPDFKWVNTIIGNVKKALHGTFHAISKKHFAQYLAEFSYRFNRRFKQIDRVGITSVYAPVIIIIIIHGTSYDWVSISTSLHLNYHATEMKNTVKNSNPTSRKLF